MHITMESIKNYYWIQFDKRIWLCVLDQFESVQINIWCHVNIILF
jgi:hypothetical protein